MFFAPAIRPHQFVPRAWDASFERFVNEVFARDVQRSLQFDQDDKNWTLSLDVPGLTREDLMVSIEGAIVRIESKPDAKRQVHGTYELPLEVDASNSEAKLENGILTLKLAKMRPLNKVSQLTIN